MELFVILLVAAATFGVCFLVDKGFTRTFRGEVQHASGLSVRLSKRYGSFGLILFVIGLAALFVGINGERLLALVLRLCLLIGPVVMLVGVGLVVYYMTFGIYYDEESFIVTTFGKRSTTYRYNQIRGQLLYNASGSILVELHMADGRTVGIQSNMTGRDAFLDPAFAAWCRQTGRDPENCDFHDPANSLWFPMMEGK